MNLRQASDPSGRCVPTAKKDTHRPGLAPALRIPARRDTATTSNNDFISKTGTLTFAHGETTKTITIEVKGDSKREDNETFYLELFGPSGNGLFSKSRGIGTILNDD